MTDQQRRANLLIALIWVSVFFLVTTYGPTAIDALRTFERNAIDNLNHVFKRSK